MLHELPSKGKVGRSTVTIGRMWTPGEFCEKAKTLAHPFDQAVVVPPAIAEDIVEAASLGPRRLEAFREENLQWYKTRAKELESEGAKLHRSLDPAVEKVVASKMVLLFKEMLSDIGYDDMRVVDLLTAGVRLVGEIPRVGIWPPDGPRCTTRSLWAGAFEAQKSVLEPRGKEEVKKEDVELWENDDGKGRRERPQWAVHGRRNNQKSWEALGSSPAFPIVQGNKTRRSERSSTHAEAKGVRPRIHITRSERRLLEGE